MQWVALWVTAAGAATLQRAFEGSISAEAAAQLPCRVVLHLPAACSLPDSALRWGLWVKSARADALKCWPCHTQYAIYLKMGILQAGTPWRPSGWIKTGLLARSLLTDC